jgi:hypothetical protein
MLFLILGHYRITMLWLSSLTKWWPLIQISIIHDNVSTTDVLRRKKRPYLESWDYDSSCEPTHKKTWLEKSPQWHEKYHTTLNTIFQCTSRQQHTPIIGDTDFDISLTQKLQEACGSHSKTDGHIPFPWLHSTPEANNNNNNERHYSSDKQRSAYTFEYTKATTLSPPLFLLYVQGWHVNKTNNRLILIDHRSLLGSLCCRLVTRIMEGGSSSWRNIMIVNNLSLSIVYTATRRRRRRRGGSGGAFANS